MMPGLCICLRQGISWAWASTVRVADARPTPRAGGRAATTSAGAPGTPTPRWPRCGRAAPSWSASSRPRSSRSVRPPGKARVASVSPRRARAQRLATRARPAALAARRALITPAVRSPRAMQQRQRARRRARCAPLRWRPGPRQRRAQPRRVRGKAPACAQRARRRRPAPGGRARYRMRRCPGAPDLPLGAWRVRRGGAGPASLGLPWRQTPRRRRAARRSRGWWRARSGARPAARRLDCKRRRCCPCAAVAAAVSDSVRGCLCGGSSRRASRPLESCHVFALPAGKLLGVLMVRWEHATHLPPMQPAAFVAWVHLNLQLGARVMCMLSICWMLLGCLSEDKHLRSRPRRRSFRLCVGNMATNACVRLPAGGGAAARAAGAPAAHGRRSGIAARRRGRRGGG